MKQPRFSAGPALIDLGGLVSGGLLELGAGLDLQTTDHDSFTTDLTDYIMKHGLHQQSKEELATRSAALKVAGKNCRNFLRVTRDIKKPVLGYQYSQAWNALGFFNTLTIPASASKFGPMMLALNGYFTSHAAAELAPMNITAAQATTLFNAFTTARQAVAAQELILKTTGNNRDAAAEVLRKGIKLLIAELADVLPSVDPRWERFGLKQPGLKQRPPTPTGLSAVLFGTGISAKWDKAARAEYYRVWVKVNGVDEEAGSIGTASDLDFVIENLPANTLVEIAVSAVNNGGESAKSAFVILQTA